MFSPRTGDVEAMVAMVVVVVMVVTVDAVATADVAVMVATVEMVATAVKETVPTGYPQDVLGKVEMEHVAEMAEMVAMAEMVLPVAVGAMLGMEHVAVTAEISMFKSTETLDSDNGHYKSFSSDLLADKVAILPAQEDLQVQVAELDTLVRADLVVQVDPVISMVRVGLLDLLDCLVAQEDKWDYDTVLPTMDTMGLLDNPANLRSNN